MNDFDEDKMFAEDRRIKDTYHKKGYLKSKQDEDDLHMAFSPYKVPLGLTKLQIRRKINKFVRGGRVADNSILNCSRLEIHINNKFVLGGSFTGKVPANHKELVKLLREIL